MKRICFIFGGNIQMCPYLNGYLDCLSDDVEYDLIYWERYQNNKVANLTKKPCNIYCFKKPIASKLKKTIAFVKFKKYINNILVTNDYDKIVFLQTNMAIMCSKYILDNCNKEYFLDIRDYSNEFNKLVRRQEDKIFPYMKYICISSDGFKTFLPDNFTYLSVHNLQNNKMMVNEIDIKNKCKTKIKIGYIGNMSLYGEYLCRSLSLFANDDRYIFYFVGIGSEYIKQYCIQNAIENVVIKGEFKPEEINSLYKEIDIVNNLYGNKTPYLDYALSNKLYLAAQYCLPILVCKNTSMEEISIKNKFGFVVDINNKNVCNELYDWYNKLDIDKLYYNCSLFNEKVVRENHKYKQILTEFLGGQ